MTGSAVHLKPDLVDITSALLDYILSQHPSKFSRDTLPRDESLLELEVLDSAGVIEFIAFAEATWGIEISDQDITKERMCSLNKKGRIYRLPEPAFLDEKVIVLCAPLFKRFR